MRSEALPCHYPAMKSFRTWKLWSAAICAASLMFAGCKKADEAGGGAAGDTIPVGEYASLTGKEAAFGQSSHRGTELAVEEINQAGGVLGKQIRLITEDTQSK